MAEWFKAHPWKGCVGLFLPQVQILSFPQNKNMNQNKLQNRKKQSESFTEKVLEIVKNIPRGSVMSYGEIAKLSGLPRAARAVGSLMAKNKNKDIPCHRVIKSNGSLGEYNNVQGKSKRLLLIYEGYIQE